VSVTSSSWRPPRTQYESSDRRRFQFLSHIWNWSSTTLFSYYLSTLRFRLGPLPNIIAPSDYPALVVSDCLCWLCRELRSTDIDTYQVGMSCPRGISLTVRSCTESAINIVQYVLLNPETYMQLLTMINIVDDPPGKTGQP
jgi:hypothetical protein